MDKNTGVCAASFLSSNGRILAHLDNSNLKLSTHAYFEMRFHSMLSRYENSKGKFYDVITNELFLHNDPGFMSEFYCNFYKNAVLATIHVC